jgi:nucleoside-diphosphate-sugar epimerase
MPTIAVAGGTGHLGLTIVEVLKENPGCRVIVLSRKVRIFEPRFDPLYPECTPIEGLIIESMPEGSRHTGQLRSCF